MGTSYFDNLSDEVKKVLLSESTSGIDNGIFGKPGRAHGP